MRKNYTPASPLHPTFVGPLRNIELYEQGALLRDPRSGDTLSVHFQNMRKISLDEFLTLLPSNFDADILHQLKMYRYNKPGSSEQAPPPATTSLPDVPYDPAAESFSEPQGIKLRSGKTMGKPTVQIPVNLNNKFIHAHWTDYTSVSGIPHTNSVTKPILKNHYPQPTPYATINQSFSHDLWNFHNTTTSIYSAVLPNYKTRYKSSFQSKFPGTLKMKFPIDKTNKRTVQFTELTVHFF